MSKRLIITGIAFFILGCLCYFYFPKDINVPDARELVETGTHFTKITDTKGYVCIHTTLPKYDNCN